MSNSRLKTLVWVLCGALLVPSMASAEDLKIGVVDAERIIKSSPQAEQATKQLEKEFAARDRELRAQQKSIKEMEDKLSKDGAVMSESEVQKIERDLATQRRDLRRDQEEYRDDLTLRRNEEFGKILKEIETSILAIAKEQGYDLVLSQGVLFASNKVDITGTVLERLKKGGGASAGNGTDKAEKSKDEQ